MSRILIVEDEPALLHALAENFRFESYEVFTAEDGEAGLRLVKEKKPDLLILDIMLPRMSGYDLCRRLRAEGVEIPVLMLTARGEEADRVVGLDLGADDYVTKPFSVRELGARVRALLRRARRLHALPDSMNFGEITVDFRSYVAKKGQRVLDLTRKEFQLLQVLVARSPDVVSRDDLLDEVWGQDCYPTTRTVDTHIANLRVKLETNARKPRHILTVHGVGYRWSP